MKKIHLPTSYKPVQDNESTQLMAYLMELITNVSMCISPDDVEDFTEEMRQATEDLADGKSDINAFEADLLLTLRMLTQHLPEGLQLFRRVLDMRPDPTRRYELFKEVEARLAEAVQKVEQELINEEESNTASS